MIIITGASRGIGKYLFDTFKEKKEEVIGFYNKTKPPQDHDSFFKLDVTNYPEVGKVIQSLLAGKEKLILINCAGINYNSFAHKSDPLEWKKVIETNLIGTYNVIRSVLPFMRANEYGRIINFSSVVAMKPTPGTSAYAATKAALWGMSKSISIENANKNITINNINMGYSVLGMIKDVPEKFLDVIKAEIPEKKLCSPIDILNTVIYLMETGYITGESININGGLT